MKYVVQKGDSLSAIARRLNVNMKSLAAFNKIKDVNKIYIGQEIKVPEERKPVMAEQVSRAKKRKRSRQRQPKQSKSLDINFSLFPKAAAAEKPMPSLMEKPKAKPRSEPIVPTNIRQLLFDVFGGDSTVTEDNLKSEELEALKSAVKSAKARGSSSIEYEDYGTQDEGESQYADVGGGGSMLGKIADPAYSMKTFIGQGGIAQNEKGETIVLDRYNFNDAVDGTLLDYLKDVKNAGLSFYGQARAIGKHFGSAPGEGSPVAINLGKIT